MFCFYFGHLINRVCLYPFPLVCWMKTLTCRTTWENSSIRDWVILQKQKCERERVCEWEKMLFSISCQVDGEAGGDPIPPGSLFKPWYKSYSEKTDGPSDRTQLLYWLLLQISLLVWAPSPKGNLSEEPKLGVMLEIGKGFRVKGTAIGSVSSPEGISTLFFVVKIAASERFLQYGHGRMSLPVCSMVGRYVAFLSKCLCSSHSHTISGKCGLAHTTLPTTTVLAHIPEGGLITVMAKTTSGTT